jgi:protein-S-isoprenylcysteine O-methyltransferase Ste14
MRASGWSKGFFRTAAATLLYAVVHSFCAGETAKRAVSRALGVRNRNALYRPFYLLQSAGTMLLLMSYVRRQPRMFVVNVRGLVAMPFRLVQLAGIGWAVAAAYEVGLSEILGIRPFLSLLKASAAIAPEPEAQGPILEGNAMRVRGPFRFSRHPLNLAPLAILWFNPRLTTNLLAYNLVSTIYLVLGSVNEERRLATRYGTPYIDYRASAVPFYLPKPS